MQSQHSGKMSKCHNSRTSPLTIFRRIFYNIFIICLALPLLLSCARPVPDKKMTQAWKEITDPHSSSVDFESAIKELKFTKGDADVWLKIAADESYEPDRRRRCVRHFFDSFVTNGMHIVDITALIGKDVNWISFDHVITADPKASLAGWVPDALRHGNSGFIIPILSGKGGQYNLTLVFSFQEDPSLADFVSILKQGKEKVNTDAQLTITGYSAWDIEDADSRYPGARFQPWPW